MLYGKVYENTLDARFYRTGPGLELVCGNPID